MTPDLSNKLAVVTGAAGGIGLAITEQMIAAGARVVMVDLDEAALNEAKQAMGEPVTSLALDLLSYDQCASLIPKVTESNGPIDIFIANAGLYVGGDVKDDFYTLGDKATSDDIAKFVA